MLDKYVETGVTAIAIFIPFLGALLRYIFHPAWIASQSSSLCVAEEVLLSSESSQQDATSTAQENNKQNVGPTQPTHMLSIVIPAYNEEDRLPIMLNETFKFLRTSRGRINELVKECWDGGRNDNENDVAPSQDSESSSFNGVSSTFPSSFEIIVVDDGSTDATVAVAREFAGKMASWGNGDVMRIVKMTQNSGKGAAVKAGMLRSNAMLVLMADADGATDINDCLKLLSRMARLVEENGQGTGTTDVTSSTTKDSFLRLPASLSISPLVVIGSRAHLQDDASIERSKLRTVLMHGFHFCVSTLCSSKLKDTQCGFKLFSRQAARKLFFNLHLQRWAFDTELVLLSDILEVPVVEVGVNWKEVDGSKLDTGSKLNLLLVSVGMLRDMMCVRLCYAFGIWGLQREVG